MNLSQNTDNNTDRQDQFPSGENPGNSGNINYINSRFPDLSPEITPEELDELNPDEYLLIDTRGQSEYDHGFIPGCVLFSPEQVMLYAERAAIQSAEAPASGTDTDAGHPLPDSSNSSGRALTPFSPDKRIILYCKYGTITRDLADQLREMGLPAQSLEGGYGAWALQAIRKEAQNAGRRTQIERSLQKGRFHRDLLNPFARAIIKYNLIQNGDKIAVCISGGKDSMLMAKLFQEFQRHGQYQFELVFLCMDPGYNEANRHIIESNADLLGIPLTFFETQIFDAVYTIPSSPCYLCARMRRGYLYKKAQELGCNKIALGHHYDDVIETVLMGMLYSGQWSAMMPKLKSANFRGMELIRPLYFVREDDIKAWRDANHLHFIQCACHFTDTCTTCAVTPEEPSAATGTAPDKKISIPAGSVSPVSSSDFGVHSTEHSGHKRTETKRLIAELKKTNPNIESNIFHATENVVVDKMLGYKKEGKWHSFLDEY